MFLMSFASLLKAFVREHRRTLKDGRVVEVQSYTTRTPQRGGGLFDLLPTVRKPDPRILFLRTNQRQGGTDDATGDLFAPRPTPTPAKPRHIGELPYDQLIARGARIVNDLVPGFETAWARAELADRADQQKLEKELSQLERDRLDHFNVALKPLYERASQRAMEIMGALPKNATDDEVSAACDADPECQRIKTDVERERLVREGLFRRAEELARKQQEGTATVSLLKRLRNSMQARVRDLARGYQITAALDLLTIGKAVEHRGVKLGQLIALEKKIVRAAVKDYFATMGIFRTGPGHLEHVGIVLDGAGQPIQRAHAGLATGTLNVGMNLSEKTIFHELAHFYEFDYPEVRQASRTFLKARRSSPAARPLAELMPNSGFDPSEVAFEDHFVHPYIGKDYGENGVTEVVSMGFERFATPASMAAFYRQDPEHFLFCLAVNTWLKERHDV